MPDYGHELLFGTFLTPDAAQPDRVVGLARLADDLGFDLVTVQDHPYQAKFLETWTLLSVIAASTTRVRVAPNVANLPLRLPAMLAKSAATLDLLSGGRVELGLGAGASYPAIAAYGGPRLDAAASIEALAEGIEIIRAVWGSGTVRVDGQHHRVHGAHAGPTPAHDIGIWLGAYRPRMLGLTGRVADGWLPSSPYAAPEALPAMNARIDEAAVAAGREPRQIRRLYNIAGAFTQRGVGFLVGPPSTWAEQLAELTLTQGMSAYILTGDDPDALRRFAAEVIPAVRELVGHERSTPPSPAPAVAGVQVWDESTRPTGPAREPGSNGTAGAHLVEVHDHFRQELSTVRDLVDQVAAGALDAGTARSHINTMTMRQNNWSVGAYCESYCRAVTLHHTLEDQGMFPHLRRADPRLSPVIDRLEHEHQIIHELLEGVDRALVAFIGLTTEPDRGKELRSAVDLLSEALLSHLSYEEHELVEPLNELGFA